MSIDVQDMVHLILFFLFFVKRYFLTLIIIQIECHLTYFDHIFSLAFLPCSVRINRIWRISPLVSQSEPFWTKNPQNGGFQGLCCKFTVNCSPVKIIIMLYNDFFLFRTKSTSSGRALDKSDKPWTSLKLTQFKSITDVQR